MTLKHFLSRIFFWVLFSNIMLGCSSKDYSYFDQIVNRSAQQFEFANERVDALRTKSLLIPRTIDNGKMKLVKAGDWTSGFYPGSLWYLYELTHDEVWKEEALKFTTPLEDQKWNGRTHDMGFKMYCSFGQAIKHVDSSEFKNILIQSAKTLAARYNPVVGCIRSWDSNPKTSQWKYPVIIDNMMNLELLMWAAKETGNENYKVIAVNHALKTMQCHFRSDFSCYHVIDYDPETGEVLHKNTHQGFADESEWARGQAWAIYGYTMMYEQTNDQRFLDQANNVAGYLMRESQMQKGLVPYWDFQAPNIPEEPYDASAAAVISSAMFRLSEFTQNKTYFTFAEQLFKTLSSDQFFAKVGQNEGFLLMHSTGSKPYDSEVDVPLNYADYYYLEALLRYKTIVEKS